MPHEEEVLFMSLSEKSAVEYYSTVRNDEDRYKAKLLVKTKLDEEIVEGVCNEECLLKRYFYQKDKDLIDEMKKLMSDLERYKYELEDTVKKINLCTQNIRKIEDDIVGSIS
jgi:hypothetical protein